MNDETKSWADLYDCADGDDRDESLLHLISHADSRYLSIELAGTGAMKKIICTEDKISGRTVAKALLKDPQDQQNIEPFLREARITAQLQHPNIVPVYDIGLDDEDNPFFTMKLITGFNLEQILTEIKQGNEQFVEAYPRAKLIEIFLKVCDAMAYAHSEGMVHLDLKPANIQVSGFGDVIVCDWGLATFIDSENELGHQHSDHYEYFNKRYFTLSGQIKGTPGYMAPEQAQGGKQKKDERTDIFALGCILYELLTMRQAIEGENLQNILDNTTQGLITAPSKRRLDLFIPSSLEAICMKALQTSRHKRYQSVEYIITEIEAYRQGFATEAEDVSFFKQVRLLYKRNHRICLLAAVLLTTIFTISFYFVNSVREKERATATALQKLKSEKELNSKIAEDASMIYAKRGRKAYFLFDSKEAIEQLEMALRLHPLNNVALEQMSKIYTVRQQFAEARKYLKPLGAGRNEDLLDFYLQVENQGLQKPLTLRQIYPLVQKHLDKSRLTLKSHIFKFAIFSTDDLKTIGKDISWLLSQENKPVNIHCNVSKRPGGFSVDLSGNKGLEKISSIGMFPILHLNLRGSKVGKVTFSNSYPLLKEVWLSKGQLSERDRRYFGNAKIIEK